MTEDQRAAAAKIAAELFAQLDQADQIKILQYMNELQPRNPGAEVIDITEFLTE